jgi:Carboxypeptidase regulatory-like domain
LKKSPALALICLLTAIAAFTQTEGARISGRVTDLRGAVIVDAQCKITNIETDVSTATTTNEDGIYVIPYLRPATYSLTIEKEGFVLLGTAGNSISAQAAHFLPEVDGHLTLNSYMRTYLQAKDDREEGASDQFSIGPSMQFYLKPLLKLRNIAAFDLNDAKHRALVL